MTILRAVAPPALIVWAGWFTASLYSLWKFPLALPDLSPDLVVLLLVIVGVAVGVAWPGGVRALAAGLGALIGNVSAWLLTNTVDARPEGDNMWLYNLLFTAIPVVSHAIGTVARDFDLRRLGPPGVSRDRSWLPVAVIVGSLWFGLHSQAIWVDGLGIGDPPGEELAALLFVSVIATGYVWPGTTGSVAAGLAGLFSAVAALALSGAMDDFAGRGFSIWWLGLFASPAAAHVLGTALRTAVDRRRMATT